MDLSEKLLDTTQFVTLYGTTPPRADAPEERIARAATRLAARIAPLPLDGVIVYDVQDEDGRTDVPRPFPYLPTIDPRVYGRTLRAAIGKPTITYKCIAEMTEETWTPWLDEARDEYAVRHLSLVGLSTARGRTSTMPLSHATQIAADHPGDFVLGGVAIAERHTPERSESARMRRKAATGCRYFISQAVYSAAPTVGLLTDYARECAESGEQARRVVLTFAPCGRAKTLDFIRWLGVSVDSATVATIIDDPAPLTRSIAICRDNLRAILDRTGNTVPLGLNIESLSIYKDEIDASIELCHTLREVAHEYGLV
jgi:hypothetical protein